MLKLPLRSLISAMAFLRRDSTPRALRFEAPQEPRKAKGRLMKTLASFTVLAVLMGPLVASDALAKGKAKPAKSAGAAPQASAEELAKFKGDFKWGMAPEQVLTEIGKRVESSYADKLKKLSNDAVAQDRVRRQMKKEVDLARKNYVRFDGTKSGYDVSIIDQEFGHGTGESMLTAKEDNATRYFFFADEKLYKMYIAFDKDMLKGASFAQFGQLMQARLGKAKEVYVDEKTKGGVKHTLDHYEWASNSGDGLRLVDRSEFYDVFCLVIYDADIARRLADARRIANPTRETHDSLVEAVANSKSSDLDNNDNVIDRIVGKEARKPGERAEDVVVESPSSGVRGPTAAEVNRKTPATSSGKSSSNDTPTVPKKAANKDGLEF